MPPRPSLPAILGALGALACCALPACEPAPAVAPPAPAPPPPSAAPSALPADGPPRREGHTAIVPAAATRLPFVLQSIPGGRGALAVAQVAGERAAWARRLDASGEAGPPLRFLDRRILGALDRPGGPPTILTSDGARVCLHHPAWSGETCLAGSPAAVVPVGDRVALLELTSTRPVEPARVAPRAAPKPPPAKKAAPGKKGAGKPAANKKKGAHGGKASKPVHPHVEVFARFVDAGGAADAEARNTGLHFEAPLDGMTLADARPRPPGIDLLWYETAPGRKARTPLGSGRLMAGSLRADGSLDFQSRVAVVDADVEYGRLKDHGAPRLVGDDSASVYLGLGAKGECEAIRVRPSLGRLTPPSSACALAPDRLAAALDAATLSGLDRLLAEQPRRAFGQPKHELGLAAWAGDRAYWLSRGELRTSAAFAAATDAPPPFPARRARIAWGAVFPDGEALAAAEGQLIHLAAGGTAERLPTPRPEAAEIPADRRPAARIGAAFFRARGAHSRLFPDPTPSSPDPGVDTSVLVGGPSVGLTLDLAGGSLHLGTLSATGQAAHLGSLTPAPVRVGFDACERAQGGALVAGVRAGNPAEVVAFSIDAAGKAGPAQRVPLPLKPGELGVRLIPLPAGGALLEDLARRHVVWLDDDARLLGQATWPAAESEAACLDGRPMRRAVPSPTPGQLVGVPDSAEGACIVGDPVWTRTGHLRWLGSTVLGLDSYAELVSFPLLSPVPVPVPAPAPVPAPSPLPSPARCPPDMVSIAARFCVDRFEATLLDARTGDLLSPDWPATPGLLDFTLAEWATGRERIGNLHARAFPLPFLAATRVGDKPEPMALSRMGARPNGYVTGVVAEAACAAAGKRLCSLEEFVTACRGEDDTLFPYGETFEDGACNVFREEHPAAVLHGNASVGHLDPRLNRVSSKGRPLLQRTGESPRCQSRWGEDAVYDLVGNLDEWVAEGGGAFAGGFYSRSTRQGCEALVTAHPKSYLDYSTGVRCCRD